MNLFLYSWVGFLTKNKNKKQSTKQTPKLNSYLSFLKLASFLKKTLLTLVNLLKHCLFGSEC